MINFIVTKTSLFSGRPPGNRGQIRLPHRSGDFRGGPDRHLSALLFRASVKVRIPPRVTRFGGICTENSGKFY